jgi:hypothetical protein
VAASPFHRHRNRLAEIHSETTLKPSEYRAPCPDANAASGAPFGGLAASSQSDGEAYTSLTDGRLPMNDDHGHPEMRTAETSQNGNVRLSARLENCGPSMHT